MEQSFNCRYCGDMKAIEVRCHDGSVGIVGPSDYFDHAKASSIHAVCCGCGLLYSIYSVPGFTD